MHEASLIENMLLIAQESLSKYNVKKVNSLQVCSGVFSGAMDDALLAAFEVATKEGLFQGSQLKIRRAPAVVECSLCGNRDEIYAFPYHCSKCGGETMQLLSGQELYLEAIDFDEAEEEENGN